MIKQWINISYYIMDTYQEISQTMFKQNINTMHSVMFPQLTEKQYDEYDEWLDSTYQQPMIKIKKAIIHNQIKALPITERSSENLEKVLFGAIKRSAEVEHDFVSNSLKHIEKYNGGLKAATRPEGIIGTQMELLLSLQNEFKETSKELLRVMDILNSDMKMWAKMEDN